MYAIISDGGRQYKVEPGNEVEINFRDVDKGSEIQFDQVVAGRGDNGFKAGAPTIADAVVKAEVLGAVLGPKHYIQKFRRRKNSRRRTGHRQVFTKVKITSISGL